MDIELILKDKTIKAKGKVEALSNAILTGEIKIADVIKAGSASKGSEKGTCVEALEFITRSNPEMSGQKCLEFAVSCLTDKAPRVRWEAAKVIGNIAGLYKTKLDDAIVGLLANTEYPGTVVRWSSAYAISSIILLNTKHNVDLIPAVEAIIQREENNAIRKIYSACLKKVQKS